MGDRKSRVESRSKHVAMMPEVLFQANVLQFNPISCTFKAQFDIQELTINDRLSLLIVELQRLGFTAALANVEGAIDAVDKQIKLLSGRRDVSAEG